MLNDFYYFESVGGFIKVDFLQFDLNESLVINGLQGFIFYLKFNFIKRSKI